MLLKGVHIIAICRPSLEWDPLPCSCLGKHLGCLSSYAHKHNKLGQLTHTSNPTKIRVTQGACLRPVPAFPLNHTPTPSYQPFQVRLLPFWSHSWRKTLCSGSISVEVLFTSGQRACLIKLLTMSDSVPESTLQIRTGFWSISLGNGAGFGVLSKKITWYQPITIYKRIY